MSSFNSTLSWADVEDDYTPVSSRPSTPQNDSSNVLELNKYDNLRCYTFTECDENSPLYEQSYRGIIKNEKDEVVCHSFGYTPEFSCTDDDNINKFINPLLKNSKCYISYEGSILRLFYNKTTDSDFKWQLSTHRKIDSFSSRWGSAKSYGELFIEILLRLNPSLLTDTVKDEHGNFVYEKIIQSYANLYNLNENYNYIFMITTSKMNRIVCNKHDENNLYFVGLFDTTNVINTISSKSELGSLPMFKYVYPEDVKSVGVPIPDSYSISEIDKVKSFVYDMNYEKYQGLIFITPEGRTVKMVHHKYMYYSKLRGNNPNILLRYLELQHEGNKDKVKEFVDLYNDQRELFIDFGKVLDDICLNIYTKYRNRFVRKMVDIAPPEQYQVIKELHSKFLENRQNIVTPEAVALYVFDMEPTKIYGLFHMYMKRKQETGNGNKLQEQFKNKVKNIVYKTEEKL
jgi:hypothetical protein